MDRRAADDRRRTGTVKTAINMYGERTLEGSSSLKKPQMGLPEKSPSRAKELLMAKRDMARYRDYIKAAESVKSQAESELSNAKKNVKDLAAQIEDTNSKARSWISDIGKLKKSSNKAMDNKGFQSRHQHAEMMRELEFVKQELSRLKLEMASVSEEKKQAEKEIKASNTKLSRNLSSMEALSKEIESVNEEQVLVELARIEALKEFGEIQSEREKESCEFVSKKEKNREKMKDATDEIDSSEELEYKLAITLSDVAVLQNELKLVKEIEKKKVLRNDSLKHSGDYDKPEDFLSLNSITEELEAAKKELGSIKEEGFQFMASMDTIRNELQHVMDETARLKKTEHKAELTVQNLNSKLLRAKTKLESAAAAEEKAKSILTNLALTLEQLKTEAEAAKKEKELITQETANIKAEIQKTEAEMDLTEEKLQFAMQEVEAVKASEALALQNLQNLIENAMRTRASASQRSSSITISKFEYEYLTGQAVRAEEIADKKVAAAEAWVEALKANEKEILMKIEIAQREIRESKLEEEQNTRRTERSNSAKRGLESDLGQKQEKTTEPENIRQTSRRKSLKGYGNSTPRKSMKGNINRTPSTRSGNVRNPASPAIRTTPGSTTSIIIRKKKKVIPDLARFFIGQRIAKKL